MHGRRGIIRLEVPAKRYNLGLRFSEGAEKPILAFVVVVLSISMQVNRCSNFVLSLL